MDEVLDVAGLSWLTHLYNVVWRSGAVPLDWQAGVAFPIFKKGDRRVFSSYGGITLLSLLGKVYARVRERRVHPLVNLRYRRNNVVFIPAISLTCSRWVMDSARAALCH